MVNYRRRMKRRQRRQIQIAVRCMTTALVVGLLAFTFIQIVGMIREKGEQQVLAKAEGLPRQVVENAPDYDVQLLTMNEYSRPGTAIDKITGIVVHYTANPGTSAQQNRDYFEGLKDSHDTKVSSHFIIGMEGELIQCIPCNEISYASNDRNHDTISIECCIPDDTGKFTSETYDTLIHLTAWLLGRYDLDTDAVIRHYDVTGKICPKYYVENEDAWLQMKADIKKYIKDYGVIEEKSTKN